METKEAIESVIEEYGITHTVEWVAGVINEKHERIEQLETALRKISHAPHGKVFCAHGHEEAYLISLNALGEKKDD